MRSLCTRLLPRQRLTRLSRIAVCVAAIVASVSCRVTSPSIASSPDECIQLAQGIRINRTRGEVIVDAQVATRIGWIEQIVCKAGSREHESLLVVEVPPRLIHAALLAVGCTAGTPGSWRESALTQGGDAVIERIPATGTPLEVLVRVVRDGAEVDVPVSAWLFASSSSDAPPIVASDRFVFAGSHTRVNPPSLGPGEHYVADYTGSVVGLVTFGDEVVAFEEVIPDKVEFAPALWEAFTDRIPPEGTNVSLVLRIRDKPCR